jgi:hypothetical protein
MAFEPIMRDCANEEDRRQTFDELRLQEEKRLADLAISEAKAGDLTRLMDGLSYRDHDDAVIATLLECAEAGHPAAKALIKSLAEKHGYHAENLDI